jgi:hypothetical protein
MAADHEFFPAALAAGAILTGFCGSFLAFRIQREASYHRQPAVDFNTGKAKDIVLGLSHFSSSFLMLILASLVTTVAGLVLPLLKMAGIAEKLITPGLVAGGLIAGLILVCGYFCVELVHYRVISNRLLYDTSEWGVERKWVLIWGAAAICAFAALVILA